MTTPPVLSVSQVEKFDFEQLGGCPRRWWFEDVRKLRAESTAAHEDGHQGHRLLAHYLTTGERPGRVRLGKAVNAVIDASRLPRPGSHLEVEQRFSGQPQRDAAGAWVPLDVTRTLWQAGHPWEGFIDLRWRSGSTVTVWDHKFSSDIHARALPAERLIRTVQMPVYALDTLRHWPDATAVNLVHLYVSRRGVESFIRHQRVSVEQVVERMYEVRETVRQMDAVRSATAQDDVPFNRAACHARMGCPHQFRCNAFRRNIMAKVEMTDEEKAVFGILKDEQEKPAKRGALSEEPQKAAGGAGGAFDSYEEGAGLIEKRSPAREALTAAVSSGSVFNLDDIFEAPVVSMPKPQPASTCEACGEVLTPENSSRLRDESVKHIGCPKDARTPEPAKLSPRAEAETSGPRCESCPHPAHDGKPCEGKRGRGKCQCGAAVEQPKPGRVLADGTKVPVVALSGGEVERLADVLENPAAPVVTGKVPALDWKAQTSGPTFEVPQDVIDGQKRWENGKRLEPEPEDVGGWSEAGEPAPAEQAKRGERAPWDEDELATAKRRISDLEEQLRTAREIMDDPELAPRGSWSGTLAVSVTVELGPSTLSLIQSILKR